MAEQESIFGPEFDDLSPIRRRELLPWWIKIFTWLFIVLGAIAVMVFFLGFFNFSTNLALYGLETNHPFSIQGLIVISLFLLKGATASGLWTEQNWAVKAGMVDAIIGIAFCIFMMAVYPFISGEKTFNARLEIILLILFLRWLMKVKRAWEKR